MVLRDPRTWYREFESRPKTGKQKAVTFDKQPLNVFRGKINQADNLDPKDLYQTKSVPYTDVKLKIKQIKTQVSDICKNTDTTYGATLGFNYSAAGMQGTGSDGCYIKQIQKSSEQAFKQDNKKMQLEIFKQRKQKFKEFNRVSRTIETCAHRIRVQNPALIYPLLTVV